MTSSTLFFQTFRNAMAESGITLEQYRRGGSEFTERIICLIEQVLSDCFGYCTEREYFRIDVIGWKGRYQEVAEEAKACRVNPHLWDLEIAVEHENDPRDWTDELVKLAHINCPLRVVIGYTPSDERESGEGGRLALAASWLKRTRAFSPSDGAFLLIFGNAAPTDPAQSDSGFDYRGYRFDSLSGQFVRLET